MKVRRRFDVPSATTLREAAQVKTVLGELDKTMEQLSRDIAAEEERVRVFDVNAPAYPILAKSLMVRRDNLRSTIAALEKRLRAIDPPAHATSDGTPIFPRR
jgi:hypothetical protein